MHPADDNSGTPDPREMEKGQKPGDILLFHRATGESRIITWFTHSPYYHAAIYAGDLHVVESRPCGVVCRDLRSREGGHAFQVIPMPENEGCAALAWAKSQIGAKYDNLDVVVIVLEHLFKRLRLNYRPPGNRYSCAEFVGEAFQKAGVTLVPGRAVTELVPADFAALLPVADVPVNTGSMRP